MKFDIPDYHKHNNKNNWKRRGLKCDDLEFEIIYNKYLNAEYCELCNKEFLSSLDRQMEHDHDTGYFRNICCRSCNMLKSDVKMRKNNTSGFCGISPEKRASCKQGFTWKFEAYINGKKRSIKRNIHLDKLIEFATEWKLENNYNT
tara:strand:- start:338 stop:775 length:438 start_codon:yes stop_codon:yes gene_type:complete